MRMKKELRISLFSLGASLIASQAHAIAITDVTIGNSTSGFDSAVAAALGVGKIKNANIDLLGGLFAGDAWTQLDSSNRASRPFNDVNFLFAADTRVQSGEWGLSWYGVESPGAMDYVLVLKSGRQWGAYLFDSKTLMTDSQKVAGTFALSWPTKKGKIAKVRKASIFGRAESAPTASEDPTGTSGLQGGTSGVLISNLGSEVDTSDDLAGTSVVPTGASEIPPVTSGVPPVTLEVPTGTSGVAADGPSRQTEASLDPDPNSVAIPGTLALLIMGMGLGLRQLKRRR